MLHLGSSHFLLQQHNLTHELKVCQAQPQQSTSASSETRHLLLRRKGFDLLHPVGIQYHRFSFLHILIRVQLEIDAVLVDHFLVVQVALHRW